MNLTELNEQRKLLRKLPGHCGSCGKPHVGEYRLCDKCRAQAARHKQKAEGLDALRRKIGLLEIRVDRQGKEIERMRAKIANVRRAAWTEGARAAKKKFDAPTPELLQEISMQEAVQISHEFFRER